MVCLVTGATGFIGHNLARELIAEGARVRALFRLKSDISPIEKMGVELVPGDLLDAESLARAVAGCQVVFHLGGLYALSAPDPMDFYSANLVGTRNILEAALRAGVQRFVHTSTYATLGTARGGGRADETTRFNRWGIADHYVRSKYLGEQEALDYHRKGLPVVVVNPTAVVGPGDWKPTPLGRFIVNFLNHRAKFYLDGLMNYVHVRDVARGHILAAKKGLLGERYILGHRNMPFSIFIQILSEASKVSAAGIWKVPYKLALASAYGCKVVTKLASFSPPFSPELVRFLKSNPPVDVSKGVNELGLPQTPVEEAVAEAVTWYRQNGYVR